jgi:hypothetical protein
MKLESAALGGSDVLQLKPRIAGGVLETSILIRALYESLGQVSIAI